MRIISGKARGRRLAEFTGKDIRPTPDRVREALFSILTSRLGSFSDLNVLELFAGSGAQSLEALSRGARMATLVDSGKAAASVISDNCQRCHCSEQVRFINGDVIKTLPQLVQYAPFDLILLDPPYLKNFIPQVLPEIARLQLLARTGIVCAESSKQEQYGDFAPLTLMEDRVYGSTRIHLYGYAGELS